MHDVGSNNSTDAKQGDAAVAGPIAEIQAEYAKRFAQSRVEVIELGRVRDYLLTMSEPEHVSVDDPVPPLFLLTLGRARRPQALRGSGVNAGEEYEFLVPLYVGDAITTERRLIEIQEKQGKKGLMYLIRVEAKFVNQHGITVGLSRQQTLRWGW